MLGRRGYPLKVAAAQVCREGGARVSTNFYVRDMDLAVFNALDSRRLEVVADGLTLFGGAQPPKTQLSSGPCTEMGPPEERCTRQYGAGRSAHTRNWQETKGGPVWWCWPLKWVYGGTQRPPSLFPLWPRLGRCQFGRSCRLGLRLRGFAGGVPSLRAARRVVPLCRCWINDPCHGSAVKADFGQSNFGQSIFGQPILANPFLAKFSG